MAVQTSRAALTVLAALALTGAGVVLVQATLTPAFEGLGSALDGSLYCLGAPLFGRDVTTTAQTGGGDGFTLQGDRCALRFELRVHSLAGNLRVWVEDPDGLTVYEAHRQGAYALDREVPLNESTVIAPGPFDAGRYQFRYDVTGPSYFRFWVLAEAAR